MLTIHTLPLHVCVQAEGVVSGAETKRWRSSWAAAAEAQWFAAGAGKFKESAAQFLISSWQGDALSVSIASPANLPASLLTSG